MDYSYKLDKDLIKDFNYQKWVSLSKKIVVPREVLNYIKFYDTVWSKKLDAWYKDFNITRENITKTGPVIPSFINIFLSPVNDKVVEQVYSKLNILPICLIDNNIFISYNPAKQEYSIYPNIPSFEEFTTDSLGETLTRYVDKWWLKPYKKLLSPSQIKLIGEFKQSLNKYSVY